MCCVEVLEEELDEEELDEEELDEELDVVASTRRATLGCHSTSVRVAVT
jgi:hypothetical protein